MEREINYEYIFLNSPDMSAFVEAHTGKILECNQTFLDQLGYEKEEVLKMTVIDLYDKGCQSKVAENLLSFSSNGDVIHSELKLLKKSGEVMQVSLKFIGVKDDNGKLLHSYAVWRDISTLKNTQKQLNREKEKVQKINEEVLLKNKIIEAKNKSFIDSVNYAERIQKAILPSAKSMHKMLPNSFTYLKPKDIVSGDFYWMHQKEDLVLFTAADSTGHGVPGAFMSMIGTALFNQVVIEHDLSSPSEILGEMRLGITDALMQDGKAKSDGMDLALCVYCPNRKVLNFAGANNSLYIIRDKKIPLLNTAGNLQSISANLEFEDKILYEIKGDKQPVGYFFGQITPFTDHGIKVEEGDLLYVFTDGFADQFGGERGKKYMYKRFKNFLLHISNEEIGKQKDLLDQELKLWMGHGMEQTDDICVIGVRV